MYLKIFGKNQTTLREMYCWNLVSLFSHLSLLFKCCSNKNEGVIQTESSTCKVMCCFYEKLSPYHAHLAVKHVLDIPLSVEYIRLCLIVFSYYFFWHANLKYHCYPGGTVELQCLKVQHQYPNKIFLVMIETIC